MKFGFILAAAGSSQRFGTDKLWQRLPNDVPVWKASYDVCACFPNSAGIIVVASNENAQRFREQISSPVVLGGATRSESIKAGLLKAQELGWDAVLIHDAARPFVTHTVIDGVVKQLVLGTAACPGVPATDTLRQVSEYSTKTVQRNSTYHVQTPQGAPLNWLLDAHIQDLSGSTDDIEPLENKGHPCVMTEGDRRNIKITFPEDLNRAYEYRTGIGYDIHAFSDDPTRQLWLGGVHFENEKALEGHSDADVLLHAIVDALMGAAGLPDIGQFHPPSDPLWKNAPSKIFLSAAKERLNALGWLIMNVDASVLAEQPKLSPRRSAMVETVANALGLSPERVNIKATTNEGLGAIGRREGIAAMATATLSRPL